MTWMLTYTGAAVDLDFADPAAISVLDIAAGLSKMNRFNGHTSRLYSVAEHSLHVCQVMEHELHVHSPQALLAGLLHDAHEAYVGDLSTPMKQAIGRICLQQGSFNPWAEIERRAEQAVLNRFGVLSAHVAFKSEIRKADLMMLRTEREALLPPGGPAWDVLAGIPAATGIRLDDCDKFEPDDWRQAFLDRYSELRQLCQGRRNRSMTVAP